jgi:outer membrane protein
MINNFNKISIFTFLALYILTSSIAGAQGIQRSAVFQGNDSLSLKTVIEEAISKHPTVMLAEEAVNNSDSRIALAKTGYYPEADLSASYSNLGPVTKLSIPNMGTFQLFPENNYSAALNYRQTIYDFGRTSGNIKLEKEAKELNMQSVEQSKQRLSILAITNFYTLVYIQAAIKIKEEQIATLNNHLSSLEKMKATGSATEYQLLSTRVRISAAESQKVDLQTSLKSLQASLNSLMGQDQSVIPVVKSDLFAEVPLIRSDSLMPFAYDNRDELRLIEKRKSLAALRYNLIKLTNDPVISFMASGGFKNGYVPNLGEIKPNYVVGVGLRVPIFDGMKNKYNLQQANSAITSIGYEAESTKLSITNEVIEAQAHVASSSTKVNQAAIQLEEAMKAYSLAETSFSSGIITNLDLLYASTAVSESRLNLLKSKIDYATSVYRLRAAMGERLY